MASLTRKLLIKNGETDGVVKNWYKTGQLKLESHYKMGLKDGPTIKWYANGQKKSEEHFKNDQPDGESVYWSSKNVVHTIRVYKEGRLVQEKNYRSGKHKCWEWLYSGI